MKKMMRRKLAGENQRISVLFAVSMNLVSAWEWNQLVINSGTSVCSYGMHFVVVLHHLLLEPGTRN